MRKTLVCIVSGALSLTAVMACSSKKPATTPSPVSFEAGIGTPPPSPSVDAAAPLPVATSDAGTGSGLFGTDAGALALPDQLADTAIDLAIQTAAAKVAPKMDKEGTTTHTTVKEGDHFGMAVTLQPGRCYTIVGFAPPGSVTQLDLKLLGVPLNTEAGRSAASDKAMPVIGKGKAALCPVLPIAMPYKIDAAATKGSGRIGIQLFSRAK